MPASRLRRRQNAFLNKLTRICGRSASGSDGRGPMSRSVSGSLRLARLNDTRQLLLLGQAESGKSTLQKQFQLMYKPNSLDQERSSWRTVIYFNVVHSIKHILTTLEAWDDGMDTDSLYSNGRSTPTMHSPGPRAQRNQDNSRNSIPNLRRRLSPLVSTDTQLADRLSGGITVSGSGKGGVFVRSGWQARTIENALGRIRARPSVDGGGKHNHAEVPQDPLVQEVGRLLDVSKDDIKELWNHPTVRALISKRRLKLDEWSELCVYAFHRWEALDLFRFSFLRHISRVAAPNYVPSTGRHAL